MSSQPNVSKPLPVLGNLRPLRDGDAADLTACCQDKETLRFTTIPQGYTEEMALEFINSDALLWAFCDDNDRLCGVIELRPHAGLNRSADVGYHTAPWARGKGMCSAALATITRWAHESGFHRVELDADVDNPASCRVAEKAGFEREGIKRGAQFLHGTFHDLALYSHLAGSN